MQTAIANPVSGVLTVNDAAQSLGVEELQIHRLIAKNILPASRIGHLWRITAANFEKFIDGGAKQIDLPAFHRKLQPSENSAWHSSELIGGARNFQASLELVYRDTFPSLVDRAKEFQRTGKRRYSIDVRLNAAGRQVLVQPVQSLFKVPDRNPVLDTMPARDLWLLREIRSTILSETDPVGAAVGGGPVSRLYSSPENFGQMIARAATTIFERRIQLASFQDQLWRREKVEGSDRYFGRTELVQFSYWLSVKSMFSNKSALESKIRELL